jgi:hypothetical protein
LEEQSDRTVRNYIEEVERLFRKHFRNPKLKLFEPVHRRGYSIVLMLDWIKDIQTAWDMIQQVGRMMDRLVGRSRKVDNS